MCLLIFSTQGNDFPLETKTPRMKARDKNKLSTTFHGAGLVVPYNKNTEIGYIDEQQKY